MFCVLVLVGVCVWCLCLSNSLCCRFCVCVAVCVGVWVGVWVGVCVLVFVCDGVLVAVAP